MRGVAGRAAALVLAVSGVLTVAACGDDDSGVREREQGGEGAPQGAADRTTCAEDAEPVADYGAGFPSGWTFPPGTVTYDVETRPGAGTIVTAITTTPFKDVLAYLNGPVTQAGFKVTSGETEPTDAEANWTGNGFTGRWAIRVSGSCEGQTLIQVLSTRQ